MINITISLSTRLKIIDAGSSIRIQREVILALYAFHFLLICVVLIVNTKVGFFIRAIVRNTVITYVTTKGIMIFHAVFISP